MKNVERELTIDQKITEDYINNTEAQKIQKSRIIQRLQQEYPERFKVKSYLEKQKPKLRGVRIRLNLRPESKQQRYKPSAKPTKY